MLSVICQHYCKDCYALNVCAIHAILEQEMDSILLDTTKCIGCGCCRTACVTFGASMIKPKMIKAEKVRPLPSAPSSPFSSSEGGEE